MTCSPGSASYFLLQAPSTDSPTWAAADVLDLISDNLIAVDRHEGGDFLKGTRESDISTLTHVARDVAGDVVIPFSEKAFELLLPLVLAPESSGTWKYAYTDSALGDFTCLTSRGGVLTARRTGCKLAQLSVFGSERGLVYLRLTIVGKEELTTAGSSIPDFDDAVYPTTQKPVSTANVVHNLASTSTPTRDFEITINNSMEPDALNSVTVTDICEQDLIPMFRYNSKAGDLSARYGTATSGISAATIITCPSGNVFTISTTKLVHGRSPISVAGRTTVQMELEGRAYSDITNTNASIQVVKT